MSFLVLIPFLALPAFAVQRHGPDFYWLGLPVLAISAVTYWVYAVDKRRAEEGLWRIPEANLYLLDLLGGWPGGFLAQRRLRHKCSKASYQFIFWLIVLAHQFVAFDSLQHWQYTRAAASCIEKSTGHRR